MINIVINLLYYLLGFKEISRGRILLGYRFDNLTGDNSSNSDAE